METPKEHKDYLRRKDYKLLCYNGIFSEREITLLKRYGYWMEALASGDIKPLTPAQERFVRVCKGECKPTTEYEIAWCTLNERREYEAKRKSTPHYDHTEPGENWFPRSEWWGNNPDRYDG